MQPKVKPNLWYHQPGHLRIKLEPGEAELSPMGHDVRITKLVNGQRLRALVPTHSLDAEMSYVPAAYAGEQGDNVVLFLPTSNEGRPTWIISKKDLDAILVK